MRTYHMGCLLVLWVDLGIHHYFYREGGVIWQALHALGWRGNANHRQKFLTSDQLVFRLDCLVENLEADDLQESSESLHISLCKNY